MATGIRAGLLSWKLRQGALRKHDGKMNNVRPAVYSVLTKDESLSQ